MPVASTMQRLTSLINTAAAACSSIHTVTVGYIGEVPTGQTDYDVLLVIPPKHSKDPRNANSRTYELHYFLIRQDKGASGDRMTEAERIAAWGSLENVNDTFVAALLSDSSQAQIMGEFTADPNSGDGDQLLPDAVVWIEVNMKIIVSACLS